MSTGEIHHQDDQDDDDDDDDDDREEKKGAKEEMEERKIQDAALAHVIQAKPAVITTPRPPSTVSPAQRSPRAAKLCKSPIARLCKSPVGGGPGGGIVPLQQQYLPKSPVNSRTGAPFSDVSLSDTDESFFVLSPSDYDSGDEHH